MSNIFLSSSEKPSSSPSTTQNKIRNCNSCYAKNRHFHGVRPSQLLQNFLVYALPIRCYRMTPAWLSKPGCHVGFTFSRRPGGFKRCFANFAWAPRCTLCLKADGFAVDCRVKRLMSNLFPSYFTAFACFRLMIMCNYL